MPNRIIRDSARTSQSIDSLSPQAEVLLWRLTLVADDFGRFEADPRIILGLAMPLKVGVYTLAEVATWLAELVRADIVRTYQAGDKALAYFVNWKKYQRTRATESRFPSPDADKCCPPEANDDTPPQSAAPRRNPPPTAADCGLARAFVSVFDSDSVSGEREPEGEGRRIVRPLSTRAAPSEQPYVDAWVARFEAPPDLLQLRRMLDALRDVGHRHSTILARFRHWLDPAVNPDGRYLSLPKFVEKFANWDPDAAPPERTADDRAAAAKRRGSALTERLAAAGRAAGGVP